MNTEDSKLEILRLWDEAQSTTEVGSKNGKVQPGLAVDCGLG